MALSTLEAEVVFVLAENLTGSSQKGNFRKEVLLTNIERRMHITECNSLLNYLKFIVKNPNEKKQLISALTIHTTSWFREVPHLKVIENYVKNLNEQLKGRSKTLKVWSAACSTGEEPYTFAFFLTDLLKDFKKFDFEVFASDLDPKSVDSAKKGIYSGVALYDIPEKYHSYLVKSKSTADSSSKSTEDKEIKISILPNIKNKCKFFVNNLMQFNSTQLENKFDIIICRNVLIYFKPEDVQKIIKNLLSKLDEGGLLILGHSESFSQVPTNLQSMGSSSYLKLSQEMIYENQKNIGKQQTTQMKNKNVLIVDDSPTMRSVLRKLLTDAEFIVDEAESAEKASEKILDKKFDLITLDLNMPGENGVQWLQRQRASDLKTPVVIISEISAQEAEKAFGALVVGAQEHLTKKELSEKKEDVIELFTSLVKEKNQQVQMWQASMKTFEKTNFVPDIICIGAGTGGPSAIIDFLSHLKKPTPPIVIVQHMKPDFSEIFLKKILEESGFASEPFSDTTPLKSNTVYTAYGDYHLEIERRNEKLFLSKSFAPQVQNHRPSIDNFLKSAVRLNLATVSIMFSGSGSDGVSGFYDLAKKNHSLLMVQDELSSTLFELPKKCLELGCVNKIGSPAELAQEMNERFHTKVSKKGQAA